MLVDPRPYTYQYRKPRYSNPTFQSHNLYESLYHRNPYQSNDYIAPFQRNLYASSSKIERVEQYPKQYKQLERNLSQVRDRGRSYENSFPRNGQQVATNPQRQMEGYKLPSINQNSERARAQSNLGNNLVQNNRGDVVLQRKQGFERFRIYERQQKPFNIISCYPKENQSNKLRNFPKLTLEDKLIERGSYHNFREEKF